MRSIDASCERQTTEKLSFDSKYSKFLLDLLLIYLESKPSLGYLIFAETQLQN